MKTKKRTLLLASAAAGLLLAGTVAGTAAPAHADDSECWGVNKCKGTGDCGGKGHSCSGKNDCAGQGWLKIDKETCLKIKGGRLTAAPEAEKPAGEAK
jgi:uncharacterized membrane protein